MALAREQAEERAVSRPSLLNDPLLFDWGVAAAKVALGREDANERAVAVERRSLRQVGTGGGRAVGICLSQHLLDLLELSSWNVATAQGVQLGFELIVAHVLEAKADELVDQRGGIIDAGSIAGNGGWGCDGRGGEQSEDGESELHRD